MHYYPISRIRLQEGSEYCRFQQRMNEYLLSVNDDTMLYNFRTAAGLDTQGAGPMTGWDAPECKLRGHTTGHYLSGLAMARAATGNSCFQAKIDLMVGELKKCRDAFEKNGTAGTGYFGAFDEEQFDLLEKFTKYPEIWAPYYTMEKMMSGLYDIYTLAGNTDALELLTGLGDWTYARLSRLSPETRKQMWSMYIAGEYGGMIAVLSKLSLLTGDKKYLKAAELFYNGTFFGPMERNEDVLDGMHANQHIPQAMGLMEMYRAAGDPRYLQTGQNFWEMVTGHHCYRMGGTGETELFRKRDSEEEYLTEKAAESCASYNMLRLTGQLFEFAPDSRYMDYYENTLLNHILATASKDATGGTVYFLPLSPGGRKEYTTDENTCCHGTGMESRYRFMEHIYAETEKHIFINLYVPSRLDGLLELKTSGDGTVTLRAENDMTKPLRLRIPGWAKDDVSYSKPGILENGWFTLLHPLKQNEQLVLRFPVKLREIPVPGSRLKCLAEGPYMMAAVSCGKSFMTVQKARKHLIRLNAVDQEPYHTYFLP